MTNGLKRASAIAFSALLAASALIAAPASAQSDDPAEPQSCYYWSDGKQWYSCCNIWDACTQIYIDAPTPSEDPAESPEK
jgi:hypothetical protein